MKQTTTSRASARIRRTIRGDNRTDSGVNASSSSISVIRNSMSNQAVYSDEFETIGSGMILPTPYDIATLRGMIERSNMIPQCVEAYVVNVVRTGWEVAPAQRGGKIDENERVELQSFIDYANSEESLMSVVANAFRDKEYLGFGFIEIIRDAKGLISLLRHAPAIRTRLGQRHKDPQLIEYDIPRGRRTAVVKEYRRFRRFVQMVSGRITWFKEFGDPRNLNCVSGLFEGEPGYVAENFATEILHIRNPSDDPYGTPRWINQTPTIMGTRESEEVNMRYFEDNTVPPMMLTVAGGRLTQSSHRELTKMLAQDGIGKERQNRIMLVEAVGEGDSLDGKGTPVSLKVEKLTDSRQTDALFGQYDVAGQAKVRSSFRLSPILVGMSNDQTYANANTALFAAETQVFAPMRVEQDEVFNRRVVNGRSGLNLRSVKLASRTPAITSPEMLMKSLTALNVMGAVTPRSAQTTANTILQIEIQPYPEKGQAGYEEWMDRPIVFVTQAVQTDDQQNAKDDQTKEVEKEGNVAHVPPENEAK